MSLRETLAGLSARRSALQRDQTALVEICETIRERWPSPSLADDADLNALADRYAQRVRDGTWGGATEAEVSRLLRAAAAGRLEHPSHLLDFLAREARLTGRAGLLAALFEGFLEGWSASASHTRRVASILDARRDGLPSPFDALLANVPQIVQIETGPADLARRLVAQDDPYARMQAFGFANPHGSGFPAAVGYAFFRLLPPPATTAAMARLMRWCRPETGPRIDDNGFVRALNLLLAPWHVRAPDDGDRKRLLDWIVTNAGDPRFEGARLWTRVEEASRRVILSWLAGESIEAFMEVISAVEIKNRHMWQSRRIFWSALYKEGAVTEAWVALHPAACREANRRFRKTGNPAYRAFGRQEGARTNTSLLIMKAGNKIVVEGSQNYRVHVFNAGFPNRPNLYEGRYKDQAITLAADDRINTKAHLGDWQAWVRRRLR